MSSPFSYKESCTGCGTCVFVCPKALLVLDNGRPMMPEENWARCNSCGQCVAYCPVGGAEQALSLGKSLDPVTPMTVSLGENIEGVLKSRRSYRTFSTLPVSRSLINRILDVANYAPSGGNNRLIRWIISDNMAKSKEIAKLIADWMDTDCRSLDRRLSERKFKLHFAGVCFHQHDGDALSEAEDTPAFHASEHVALRIEGKILMPE